MATPGNLALRLQPVVIGQRETESALLAVGVLDDIRLKRVAGAVGIDAVRRDAHPVQVDVAARRDVAGAAQDGRRFPKRRVELRAPADEVGGSEGATVE